jgi:hypothetical protein
MRDTEDDGDRRKVRIPWDEAESIPSLSDAKSTQKKRKGALGEKKLPCERNGVSGKPKHSEWLQIKGRGVIF